MSKKQKMESFDPRKHGELLLLDKIYHEIQNFKPGFSSRRAVNTFIISPAGSDWFGVDVSNDRLTVGVPEPLMTPLMMMNIINVTVMTRSPGIFVVFRMGNREIEPGHYAALRIYCREKRTQLIRRCRKADFRPMDDNGVVRPIGTDCILDRVITVLDKPNWIAPSD